MTIVDFSQIRDFQGLGLALNSIIAPLNESMKTFNDFLANYNKKVQEVDDKVNEAEKRISKLELTVEGQQKAIDRLERMEMQKTVIIHGLPIDKTPTADAAWLINVR
ncbi:unnamed protein product, partial [Allacma fusca]